jgi:uracil-DNA glycosylase
MTESTATINETTEATSTEFDPGPNRTLARHLADMPSYASFREHFWYDWGPIFYRGRLDGSAKLMAIASDPGPTERIAGRTLVGDAGQRVQGFLSKLGLTRSYVLVNAYAYALHPSRAQEARPLLSQSNHKRWRNKLYDMVSGSALEAIVAFGGEAQAALELWDGRPDVPFFELPHPSSRNPDRLIESWREGVEELRSIVTPDFSGTLPSNYGGEFRERDYARIPSRDLPFGLPSWFGDDSWGRTGSPRHNNSVERPGSDLEHTLEWHAPPGQP